MDAISSGLKIGGGGTIRGAQAVRSTDFERVWFVSADLQGSGLEGKTDIATWATNDLNGAGAIYSVDAVAAEFSDWGRPPSMSMSDDGAQASAQCARDSVK